MPTGKTHSYDRFLLAAVAISRRVYRESVGIKRNLANLNLMLTIVKLYLRADVSVQAVLAEIY